MKRCCLCIGNEIKKEGARALRDLLKSNTGIVSLDLSCDKPTPFANTTTTNEGLEILLTDGGVSSEGVYILSDIFERNSSLTKLNLTCCKFDIE